MEKIILVASPGGHFIQLSLLSEKLDNWERVVVGTYNSIPSFIKAEDYKVISDFSRTDCYKSLKVILESFKIINKIKPKVVVTTGAAPGLIFCLAAKFKGIKTIWIDSIANSKKLSLSGKIAKYCGITVISQWEDVCSSNELEYHGRVI